ncbi:uncharacterized protein LOC110269279 [Arachis ipaensis]|uniref:uncharacterized protein LOC110269279 n=1 Tax=Arachis ipaensis TaxID=130454 RepID=UPI000A2B1454|nr:uncharacterized protein LOC110269279 [Arachis ipaensis]
MSNNLYCLLESGERRTLGIVVELGLEDVVDIVGVGGDAVVEDVEVDASSGKYDSFVIDSDEDLHILFYCHCQFPEVRIPELLAKLVDVVSSSGGSNRNHQSVPMATASSLTLVVASSFVLVILSAGDLVASLTFAADLHRDEIAKQGANVNTPVMIPISRAVGEPDAVQDVLREDDDVDPATIVDDSDDDIGRSISVGPGGVLSSGTQKYPPHFSTLDFDAMRPEELPDVQSGFSVRDSQDTAGLAEFQVGQQFQNKEVILCVMTYIIHREVEYKMMKSDHDKYYNKCKEFGNSCRWLIQITLRQRKGIWEVRRYNRTHACLGTSVSGDHKKLDYHVISAYILPMIRADVSVFIKVL